MRKGELTDAVRDRSVFRQLHTESASRLNGAQEEHSGDVSDLRIVTAGPLPGYGDMPWRQVTAAANSLTADGLIPWRLMLQGFIPQTLEESELREMMKQFEAEARSCAMTFCSVDIQVSGCVTAPHFFVSGIGERCDFRQNMDASAKTGMPSACSGSRKLHPGMELVLVRQIGLAGTAALARAYEHKLRERFPDWLIARAKGFDRWMSITEAARAVNHFGGCTMYRVAQGGIFNALWKITDASGVGLEVDLREIPVYQETIEICEFFDVNPYYLYSEGALLVGTEQAEALIAALADGGIPACVIGRTTDRNDRVIRNGENRRYLDRPQQDELWRLSEKTAAVRDDAAG